MSKWNACGEGGVMTAVVVASGGMLSAALPVVVAVSEEAQRNTQFAAAFFAALIGFGTVLGWFVRQVYKAMKWLHEINEGVKENAEHIKTVFKHLGIEQGSIE